MSAIQPKDTAFKTEELAAEASEALLPPPLTAKGVATTGKAMYSSRAALSLFDQLKNSVNLNSLTIGAGGNGNANTATTPLPPPAAAAATQEATPRTTTADTPTVTRLPAPPVPSAADIELKPPAKPARTFSTPCSIGIVQGTKRGAGCVTGGLGAQAAKLDINALRSQLYQGARKTATTTTTTTNTITRQGTSKTTTERGSGTRGSKKRCLDRYDSSESSDR
ncbi:hypothetical protein KR032_012042 [Drosophila birchii]|nr:hypothetical protein KR032_012042 [Drosophila birchii]